jgi:hypothetical protein
LAALRSCLVDTGPIVAYLDARDPDHERVVRWWDDYAGGLLTTSAVIAEAMHFVATGRDGPTLLAELIELAQIAVHECAQPKNLRRAVALMRKYADTPMDFADATLVLLGDETRVHDVATLDRRGFSTYRGSRGKAFRLVLDFAEA